MKDVPSDVAFSSNGTGTGTGLMGKMLRMLHYHEERAAAYRLVIDEMTSQRQRSSMARAPQTLQQAIMQDAARRQTRQAAPQPRSKRKIAPRGTHTDKIKAQRQKTATLLATFDRTEPRPITPKLSVMVQHGYLAKKADGYVRTAKEYVV